MRWDWTAAPGDAVMPRVDHVGSNKHVAGRAYAARAVTSPYAAHCGTVIRAQRTDIPSKPACDIGASEVRGEQVDAVVVAN